jgi:hypothetical protein
MASVLHSGLPENLCPPGGARTLVRHGPEQSQPVDSRPLTRLADSASYPRRCPCSLSDGPGAAARRLGGRRGACRHAAGGSASGPPFAHDGTERRIVRPQEPAQQTGCYSGKKKDHTVKNILLVNAPLTILFLSDTCGGRVHDKRMADATPYPFTGWEPVVAKSGLPGVHAAPCGNPHADQEATRRGAHAGAT